MPTLILFRNEDQLLEEPFRLSFPAHIDTLAELCTYMTDALPPLSDASGKGYRFLYSVNGKPLWRVADCVDAGTLVVSTKPGFLSRKAITTSEDAAAARDVTPADVRAEMERSTTKGASQSPPAQQPEAGGYYSHGAGAVVPPQQAGTGLGSSGSDPRQMSIHVSASPYGVRLDSDPATHRVSIAGHGAAWTGATTAGAATAPSSSPGGHAHAARTEKAYASHLAPPPSDGPVVVEVAAPVAPSSSEERVEGKRLFTPEDHSQEKGEIRAPSRQRLSSSVVPPPTDLRGVEVNPLRRDEGTYSAAPFRSSRPSTDTVGDRREAASSPSFYERPIYGGGSQHLQGTQDNRTHRGEVRIDGVSRPLPPAAVFASAEMLLNEDGFQEDEHVLTGLRTYAARKWTAFSGLNAIPPTDVLGEDIVTTQVEEHLASLQWPLRVLVSGPPRSGVSTTAALALRAAICKSARDGPLANHLLLVLDSELLFGASMEGGGSKADAAAPPLLDVAFAFQLVTRAVLDAVSVQRPSLRPKGLLIAQLWDKLVTVNTTTPPDFTTYAQVTAAVGHAVVARWDRFARTVFPILQAARRQSTAASSTRAGATLRDAALDIIFYALPTELAASLRFSGVTYALDGLHILAASHHRRVERPLGDLGPVLRPLWKDEHCHVIVAWTATVPLQSVYLDPPSAGVRTLQLRTVGLLPTPSSTNFMPSQYRGPPLPQLVECLGRQYGADVFLGCPGYLAPLSALARPLVGRSVPTTAFSTYSQRRKREKATEPFNLRIDDPEVDKLLRQLEQLVAVAK